MTTQIIIRLFTPRQITYKPFGSNLFRLSYLCILLRLQRSLFLRIQDF